MTEGTVDLERMLDLTTPWCLRVAATLRIPEHIAATTQRNSASGGTPRG